MTVINLNILIWFLVSEVICAITSIVRDACGKAPSERLFLDKYGKICLCLDEIVWKVSFVKKICNSCLSFNLLCHDDFFN